MPSGTIYAIRNLLLGEILESTSISQLVMNVEKGGIHVNFKCS